MNYSYITRFSHKSLQKKYVKNSSVCCSAMICLHFSSNHYPFYTSYWSMCQYYLLYKIPFENHIEYPSVQINCYLCELLAFTSILPDLYMTPQLTLEKIHAKHSVGTPGQLIQIWQWMNIEIMIIKLNYLCERPGSGVFVSVYACTCVQRAM